jgi:protein TonB
MLAYATTRPARPMDASRVATAAISLILHVLVVVALVVSALWATGSVPEPPTILAFVADAAPPPPPPPPAPPAPAETKSDTPKRRAPQPATRKALPQVPTVKAPIEAPTGIAEETGREVYSGMASGLAAGFEGGIVGGVIGGLVGGIDRAMPPPPPEVKSPVRVGGQITAPRLIHRVAPEYPLIAQSAHIEGTVTGGDRRRGRSRRGCPSTALARRTRSRGHGCRRPMGV